MENFHTRNYGIDALKIVSMVMIVSLHILSHGGILEKLGGIENNGFFTVWLLRISVFCAVNCFAMASGYLMVNKSFRYIHIIKLWIQVAFYSIIIAGFLKYFIQQK